MPLLSASTQYLRVTHVVCLDPRQGFHFGGCNPTLSYPCATSRFKMEP